MRPSNVTAAGVIEIILGVLVLALTMLALSTVNEAVDEVPSWFYGLVAVSFAQGALEILAGVLILRLRPAGRILGIVMASIGIVFQLLSLSNATAGAIVLILLGIGLRALVIVFLNQAPSKAAFGR